MSYLFVSRRLERFNRKITPAPYHTALYAHRIFKNEFITQQKLHSLIAKWKENQWHADSLN